MLVKAILTKPLDGDPEGTPREFEKVDFDRLVNMEAVRAATDEEGKRQDGPTIDEFVAAGYLASNYPPDGYASRSASEAIALAVAAEKARTEQPLPVEDALPKEEIGEKEAPLPANKRAPKPLNKAAPEASNKSAE